MRHLSVVVIGAGFGGLAAAIELKRHGVQDLVIVDQAQDVGGVWRENDYPGAACDVPSPYYSFSFEPNARWPHRFSRQPAILDYLRSVADGYDLRRHLRLGHAVTAAAYGAGGRWRVTLDDDTVLVADAVVAATGQLSRPAWPQVPGRERFAGAQFHSAQWDHSVPLAGRRVAVVGTGASAIQLIPEIQPAVGHLTVFQRSAAYLVPRPDTAFGPAHHALFARLPMTQRSERATWWAICETVAIGFLYNDRLSAAVTAYSRWHMRRQVRDPGLLARLTPDYPIGCKRLLFSNDYLPAMQQPNVELVTHGVREVTATGLVDSTGVAHDVDVIVWATGFDASDFLAPIRVTGRGGKDLHQEWSDGAHAYLGISVPDFPNLFLMYGPNTNVGAGSIVFMHEQQAAHVAGALAHSAQLGRPVQVRRSVAAAYDAEMQERLRGSVWTRCHSWYRDASGRISSNWPGTSLEYRRRSRRFRPADYEAVEGEPVRAAASEMTEPLPTTSTYETKVSR